MSSSNPIIPPGSPLHRTRHAVNSKLVLTICGLVAVHVFILAGLLIQGCQRQDTSRGALPELGSNLPPLASEPEGTAPPPVETAPRLEPLTPAPQPAPAPSTPSTTTPGTITDSRSRPETAPFPQTTPNVPTMDIPPTTPDQNVVTVTYVVKAGDNLTKIARAHGTTVKAIREANNLKTDRILVGQKLKVPQSTASTQPATPGPNPAPLPR